MRALGGQPLEPFRTLHASSRRHALHGSALRERVGRPPALAMLPRLQSPVPAWMSGPKAPAALQMSLYDRIASSAKVIPWHASKACHDTVAIGPVHDARCRWNADLGLRHAGCDPARADTRWQEAPDGRRPARPGRSVPLSGCSWRNEMAHGALPCDIVRGSGSLSFTRGTPAGS